MLRNHNPLVLNWFKAKGQLSSGAVEGLNLKAKLHMRKPVVSRPLNVVGDSVTILIRRFRIWQGDGPWTTGGPFGYQKAQQCTKGHKKTSW
jgi:hypothetical protein